MAAGWRATRCIPPLAGSARPSTVKPGPRWPRSSPKQSWTAPTGSASLGGSLRLFEYLERWLTGSVRDTVRATTYENYAYLVRTYIVPSLGRIKLKALTPAHVQRFYREKLDSGLAPWTV